MTKYKINKNKPSPSEESINKHKDFNKLLNNYNNVYSYKKATTPLYKNKKFLIFVISVAVVFLAIVLEGNEENNNNEKGTVTDSAAVKYSVKDTLPQNTKAVIEPIINTED